MITLDKFSNIDVNKMIFLFNYEWLQILKKMKELSNYQASTFVRIQQVWPLVSTKSYIYGNSFWKAQRVKLIRKPSWNIRTKMNILLGLYYY